MHPHVFQLASSPPNRPSSRPAFHRTRSSANTKSASSSDDHGGHTDSDGRDDATVVERRPSATTTAPVTSPVVPSIATATDVEGQVISGAGGAGTGGRLPQHSPETDPYGLSSAYKSDKELREIKATGGMRKRPNARTSTPLEGIAGGTAAGGDASGTSKTSKISQMSTISCLPLSLPSFSSLPLPPVARRAVQTHRLQDFYKTQNAAIERMLKSVEEHQADSQQEQGDDHLQFRIAVYGSFVANLVLAALQIYGAVSSGSLSLFTTMADAIFDPMSNVTLIITNRAVKRVNPDRFPSGKARLETVGNIVFCFLMTAVSAILIAFSARELADNSHASVHELKRFHLPSVIAVVIAFSSKLVLFLYTWALKDKYSQAYILWQDHRNDLLINGFGILTSVGGSKLVWWIDPMGAILISLTVSTIWLRTAFSEFLLLVGVVASVETQQLITYVCMTHSPAVRQIDTVRVYHSGPRLIAEVDVVMESQATLEETHDVAEDLQSKLECLPDIERAYVHVDYETTHKPEHGKSKIMFQD